CTVGIFDGMDLRNIGMIQTRENLRFTLKSRQSLGVRGETFRQELQCNFALQSGIDRPVHFSHTAFAQQRRDLIYADSRTDRYRHLKSADYTPASETVGPVCLR